MKLNKNQLNDYKNLTSNNNFMEKIKLKNEYDKELRTLNNLTLYLEDCIQNVLDNFIKNDMIYYLNDEIHLSSKGKLGTFITNGDPIIIIDIKLIWR